jgi:alpha-amylase/alpha-mannosidase (GH57 family)
MRYVCVHGHFYQPPRENPSLEAIELQDSAYPYHDWNERITAECYAPNATSRIVDQEQRILQLVNNYGEISFNFGPTLLSWLEDKVPKVYASILSADKQSQERFSGHGSALAQGYNHMILPLASTRDKITQIKWGIRDFEHRFGRKPEGLWLPETAVNTETLEILADQGILFTILAPRQAKRVRRKDSRAWKDVTGDKIDPSRAYQVRLSPKKSINVFFYDGPISQGVAFEGLLNDGKRFAERLLTGFSDARDWPQLAHIATDGESYGHHHRYGEMALTYALNYIETNKLAELTNYGKFLAKHPADHFVEIVDNSSWSCVHGIERWRSNCGCNSGGHGDWNQSWREPLRNALDWLRDTLAPLYEQKAAQLLKDPWAARDAYIDVILDRSDASLAAFFAAHAARELHDAERVTALKLLEIQRHAMLMYTSCGWFFDELSGLETVQVLHYAGHAVQLAKQVLEGNLEGNLEDQFVEKLRAAKSNLREHGDGAQIYDKWVRPACVDMEKLAGHYAISSLFENYGEKTKIYCYDVDREDYSLEAEGKLRLATGRARFSSEITRDTAEMSFAVLHLGDHNITGGAKPADAGPDDQMGKSLAAAFSRAETAEVIRQIDEAFPNHKISLRNLFRDEQRKITELILNDSLRSAAAAYKTIYENQGAMMRFLEGLNIPVPVPFKSAAEVALNSQLHQAVDRTEIDFDTINSLLKEAEGSHVSVDTTTLEYAIRRRLEKQAADFADHSDNLESAENLRKLLEFALSLPFPVVIWEVQNMCYLPLLQELGKHRDAAASGDARAQQWMSALETLREKLRIQTPPPEITPAPTSPAEQHSTAATPPNSAAPPAPSQEPLAAAADAPTQAAAKAS